MTVLSNLRLDIVSNPTGVATPPAPAAPASSSPSYIHHPVYEQLSYIEKQAVNYLAEENSAGIENLLNLLGKIRSGESFLAYCTQTRNPFAIVKNGDTTTYYLAGDDPLTQLLKPSEFLNGANLDQVLARFCEEKGLTVVNSDYEGAVVEFLSEGNAEEAQKIRDNLQLIKEGRLFYSLSGAPQLLYFEKVDQGHWSGRLVSADVALMQRFYENCLAMAGYSQQVLQQGTLNLIDFINAYGQGGRLTSDFWGQVLITPQAAQSTYLALGLLRQEGGKIFQGYYVSFNFLQENFLGKQQIRKVYVQNENVLTAEQRNLLQAAGIEIEVKASLAKPLYVELLTDLSNLNDYTLVMASQILSTVIYDGERLLNNLTAEMLMKLQEPGVGDEIRAKVLGLALKISESGADTLDLSNLEDEYLLHEDQLMRTILFGRPAEAADAALSGEEPASIGYRIGEEGEILDIKLEDLPVETLDYLRDLLEKMGVSRSELGSGSQVTPTLILMLRALYMDRLSIQPPAEGGDPFADLHFSHAAKIEEIIPALSSSEQVYAILEAAQELLAGEDSNFAAVREAIRFAGNTSNMEKYERLKEVFGRLTELINRYKLTGHLSSGEIAEYKDLLREEGDLREALGPLPANINLVETLKSLIKDLNLGINELNLLLQIFDSDLTSQELRYALIKSNYQTITINAEFLGYLEAQAVRTSQASTLEQFISNSEIFKLIEGSESIPENLLTLVYYYQLKTGKEGAAAKVLGYFINGGEVPREELADFLRVISRKETGDETLLEQARSKVSELNGQIPPVLESSLKDLKVLINDDFSNIEFLPSLGEPHSGTYSTGSLVEEKAHTLELYGEGRYIELIYLDLGQIGVTTFTEGTATFLTADTLRAVIDAYSGERLNPQVHVITEYDKEMCRKLLETDGIPAQLRALLTRVKNHDLGSPQKLSFSFEETAYLRGAGLTWILEHVTDPEIRAAYEFLFSAQNLYSDFPGISQADKQALEVLFSCFEQALGRDYINNEDIKNPQAIIDRFPPAKRQQILQAFEVLRGIATAAAMNIQLAPEGQTDAAQGVLASILGTAQGTLSMIYETVRSTLEPPTLTMSQGTDVWAVMAAKSIFFPEKVAESRRELIRSQIMLAVFNSLKWNDGETNPYTLDRQKLIEELEKLNESAHNQSLTELIQALKNQNGAKITETLEALSLSSELQAFFITDSHFSDNQVLALRNQMYQSISRYKQVIEYLTSDRIDLDFLEALLADMEGQGELVNPDMLFADSWFSQIFNYMEGKFLGGAMRGQLLNPLTGQPINFTELKGILKAFIEHIKNQEGGQWDGWASFATSPHATTSLGIEVEVQLRELIANYLMLRQPFELSAGGYELSAVGQEVASDWFLNTIRLVDTNLGVYYNRLQYISAGASDSAEGGFLVLDLMSNLPNWNKLDREQLEDLAEKIREKYESLGPQGIFMRLSHDCLLKMLEDNSNLNVAGSTVFHDLSHARELFAQMVKEGLIQIEGDAAKVQQFKDLVEEGKWEEALNVLEDKDVILNPHGDLRIDPWNSEFGLLSAKGNKNFILQYAQGMSAGETVELTVKSVREGTLGYQLVWLFSGEEGEFNLRMSELLGDAYSLFNPAPVGSSAGIPEQVGVVSPQDELNTKLAAVDSAIASAHDPALMQRLFEGAESVFMMMLAPLSELFKDGNIEDIREALQAELDGLGFEQNVLDFVLDYFIFKLKFGPFMWADINYGITADVVLNFSLDWKSVLKTYGMALIPLAIFPKWALIWYSDAVMKAKEGDYFEALLEFWLVNTITCRTMSGGGMVQLSAWHETFKVIDSLSAGVMSTMAGLDAATLPANNNLPFADKAKAVWEAMLLNYYQTDFRPMEMILNSQAVHDLATSRGWAWSAARFLGKWGLGGPYLAFDNWLASNHPAFAKVFHTVLNPHELLIQAAHAPTSNPFLKALQLPLKLLSHPMMIVELPWTVPQGVMSAIQFGEFAGISLNELNNYAKEMAFELYVNKLGEFLGEQRAGCLVTGPNGAFFYADSADLLIDRANSVLNGRITKMAQKIYQILNKLKKGKISQEAAAEQINHLIEQDIFGSEARQYLFSEAAGHSLGQISAGTAQAGVTIYDYIRNLEDFAAARHISFDIRNPGEVTMEDLQRIKQLIAAAPKDSYFIITRTADGALEFARLDLAPGAQVIKTSENSYKIVNAQGHIIERIGVDAQGQAWIEGGGMSAGQILDQYGETEGRQILEERARLRMVKYTMQDGQIIEFSVSGGLTVAEVEALQLENPYTDFEPLRQQVIETQMIRSAQELLLGLGVDPEAVAAINTLNDLNKLMKKAGKVLGSELTPQKFIEWLGTSEGRAFIELARVQTPFEDPVMEQKRKAAQALVGWIEGMPNKKFLALTAQEFALGILGALGGELLAQVFQVDDPLAHFALVMGTCEASAYLLPANAAAAYASFRSLAAQLTNPNNIFTTEQTIAKFIFSQQTVGAALGKAGGLIEGLGTMYAISRAVDMTLEHIFDIPQNSLFRHPVANIIETVALMTGGKLLQWGLGRLGLRTVASGLGQAVGAAFIPISALGTVGFGLNLYTALAHTQYANYVASRVYEKYYEQSGFTGWLPETSHNLKVILGLQTFEGHQVITAAGDMDSIGFETALSALHDVLNEDIENSLDIQESVKQVFQSLFYRVIVSDGGYDNFLNLVSYILSGVGELTSFEKDILEQSGIDPQTLRDQIKILYQIDLSQLPEEILQNGMLGNQSYINKLLGLNDSIRSWFDEGGQLRAGKLSEFVDWLGVSADQVQQMVIDRARYLMDVQSILMRETELILGQAPTEADVELGLATEDGQLVTSNDYYLMVKQEIDAAQDSGLLPEIMESSPAVQDVLEAMVVQLMRNFYDEVDAAAGLIDNHGMVNMDHWAIKHIIEEFNEDLEQKYQSLVGKAAMKIREMKPQARRMQVAGLRYQYLKGSEFARDILIALGDDFAWENNPDLLAALEEYETLDHDPQGPLEQMQLAGAQTTLLTALWSANPLEFNVIPLNQ